jgi:hypothetical protein
VKRFSLFAVLLLTLATTTGAQETGGNEALNTTRDHVEAFQVQATCLYEILEMFRNEEDHDELTLHQAQGEYEAAIGWLATAIGEEVLAINDSQGKGDDYVSPFCSLAVVAIEQGMEHVDNAYFILWYY